MTRMTLIGLRLRALTEYTRTRARNGIVTAQLILKLLEEQLRNKGLASLRLSYCF